MNFRVDIVHGLIGESDKPVVLCSFFFDGEKVTCTNETFLKLARTMGVIGADGRTYFPEHGMDFLRALPILYSGPHLKATDPVQV
jgi:hypothetical protein